MRGNGDVVYTCVYTVHTSNFIEVLSDWPIVWYVTGMRTGAKKGTGGFGCTQQPDCCLP